MDCARCLFFPALLAAAAVEAVTVGISYEVDEVDTVLKPKVWAACGSA